MLGAFAKPHVAYNEGQVKPSGKAESAAALGKAVLLAGNVEGVVNVLFDDVRAPSQTPAMEYYEICKGDILSVLAKRFSGNSMAFEIFEADREVIKDPDLIYPGQKIRIPLSES